MPSLMRTKFLALSMGERFLKSNNKSIGKYTNDELTIIKWHHLDKDYVKLNFDSLMAGGKAATSFAIKDHNGILIVGGALNLDGATISKVEARVLREGLFEKGCYEDHIIEGESKLVIQAVLGRSDTVEFNAYY